MPTMPFGQYRGQSLSGIPTEYLRWAITVAREAWLKNAIVAELHARAHPGDGDGHEHRAPPPPPPSGSAGPSLHDLVERARRELARKHHPDAGGNGQFMAGINALADHLLNRGRRR